MRIAIHHRKGSFSDRWIAYCKENGVDYRIVNAYTTFDHYHGREMGYAYFQDFIPNNTFDIRVVVIGDKLMAEKRYARKGDFRASGSGLFEYGSIPENVMKIAFETAEKLQLQSVAFDFIFDKDRPFIVEMSYGFGTHGIAHSGGYWT